MYLEAVEVMEEEGQETMALDIFRQAIGEPCSFLFFLFIPFFFFSCSLSFFPVFSFFFFVSFFSLSFFLFSLLPV